jgi:hypothetical protein
MSEYKERTSAYLTRRGFLKLAFPSAFGTFLALKRAENAIISASLPKISLEENQEVSPVTEQREIILSSKSISLNDRHPNWVINGIVRKNILLCLAYMNGDVDNASEIDWTVVDSPSNYKFTLQPNEVFAFQEKVLPQYTPATITTRSNYSFEQGFLWDGKIYGGGVCDLASLMCWAAKTAGLNQTYAPTNHSKPIPGIPDEYTVSIFSGWEEATHNLYIPNNMDKPVSFEFSYDGNDLSVNVVKKVTRYINLQPKEQESE